MLFVVPGFLLLLTRSNIQFKIGLGVQGLHFIILFNFANYSPSMVMELKVSKEIKGK